MDMSIGDLIGIVVQYAPAVAVCAYLVVRLMRMIEVLVASQQEANEAVIQALERIIQNCSRDAQT